MMNPKRVRSLKKADPAEGPVLYWMDRDRRLQDNWALIHAQEKALVAKQPLLVLYVVPPTFLESTWRQQHFMIEGLKEIEADSAKKGISFVALPGDPAEVVPAFVKKYKVSHVVTDFTPLRLPRAWRKKISSALEVPFDEVDARNVVPCWEASDKLEFAAYTIRPKIHRKLKEFLDDFPSLKKHPHAAKLPQTNWKKIEDSLEVDRSFGPSEHFVPGEKAAFKVLKTFLEVKRRGYAEQRNDPTLDALSDLSPYLHYGMISAQRVALECQGMDVFLEELIVRRELSDNYCYYQPHYDSFKGFPEWAQRTLNEHRDDAREYTYSKKQWEEAKTHDRLWNAAQMQMVKTGKMHGYMRMYWAKKILEWTKTPEEAQKIALYLNDKYELDGRDSNGYVGVAWSMGGVHDRAWTERPVYGKIRYMNANGCKRKFDVKKYIETWLGKEQAELFKPGEL